MDKDRFEKRKDETKQAIQQSFIKMLQTRAFDEITVREIAEEAGIGFKTFYRHYKDKTELTQAIFANFVIKLQEVVVPPLTREDAESNIYPILDLVRDNATTMRAIGQMPNREDLAQPIIQFAFMEGLKLQVSALSGEGVKGQKRRELVAQHFVHAQLALFVWWVSEEMVIPIEEMADLINKLVIRPIWTL
ncbi:MAG: TetR/AcrR family transcriptional regulator [Chloroflexota bacterium]